LSSSLKWLPPEFALESRKLMDEADQQKQREERYRRAAERERNRNVNRPAPGEWGGGVECLRCSLTSARPSGRDVLMNRV
jgi:hypothetical protein